MNISKDQFLKIFKRCPPDKIDVYLTEINKAFVEGSINSKERIGMFCSQVAHESGELRWWKEHSDGKAYEGRKNLGNIHPGDGPKYIGRSPIQLTGFNNYKAAGDFLKVDLINHPELAETPEVGFRICVWFWTINNLNIFADKKDVKGATKTINGGTNGIDQRLAYYQLAMSVL